jgi:prevent-host-death family protein
MARYSVATTKDKLSSLIDHALAGEHVVITRHGKPTAELRPVGAAPDRAVRTRADWSAWLKSRLVRPAKSGPGAVDLVRAMRDEGAH